MKGGVLPKTFMEKNKQGVRGGVEYGFMSTTVDKDVATSYAQGGVSTVMCMAMGMVDRGAYLSPFSQYPHEKEICFPPLTGIEVLTTAVESSTLVVNSRLSVNLASLPIKDVICKRGKMLRDMTQNLFLELQTVARKEKWWQFDDDVAVEFAEAVRTGALDHVRRTFSKITEKDPESFNDDDEYERVTVNIISAAREFKTLHELALYNRACRACLIQQPTASSGCRNLRQLTSKAHFAGTVGVGWQQ